MELVLAATGSTSAAAHSASAVVHSRIMAKRDLRLGGDLLN